MKLVEMKCKNCGAPLKVEENSKEIKCDFCKTQYKLDDEVKHIKYDGMEQAGYEFEKGRIKAQMEITEPEPEVTYKKRNNALIILAWIFLFPFMLIYFILTTNKLNKDQKNKALWIMGWIFCFPIPLTILIWKSKFSKNIKILLTVLLWGLILVIGIMMPEEPIESPSDNNINEIDKNIENDKVAQTNWRKIIIKVEDFRKWLWIFRYIFLQL